MTKIRKSFIVIAIVSSLSLGYSFVEGAWQYSIPLFIILFLTSHALDTMDKMTFKRGGYN